MVESKPAMPVDFYYCVVMILSAVADPVKSPVKIAPLVLAIFARRAWVAVTQVSSDPMLNLFAFGHKASIAQIERLSGQDVLPFGWRCYPCDWRGLLDRTNVQFLHETGWIMYCSIALIEWPRLQREYDRSPPGVNGRGAEMSFQTYLDNIEDKTGLTPRQFLSLAHAKGFDDPSTKPAIFTCAICHRRKSFPLGLRKF
jgi:hypothetical protein